jgi:hypothetical protein
VAEGLLGLAGNGLGLPLLFEAAVSWKARNDERWICAF